jgi:hypothetical protein
MVELTADHSVTTYHGYKLGDDLESLSFSNENTYGKLVYYKAVTQYSNLPCIGPSS